MKGIKCNCTYPKYYSNHTMQNYIIFAKTQNIFTIFYPKSRFFSLSQQKRCFFMDKTHIKDRKFYRKTPPSLTRWEGNAIDYFERFIVCLILTTAKFSSTCVSDSVVLRLLPITSEINSPLCLRSTFCSSGFSVF